MLVAMLRLRQGMRLEHLHGRASWGLLSIYLPGLGKGAASHVAVAMLHPRKQPTARGSPTSVSGPEQGCCFHSYSYSCFSSSPTCIVAQEARGGLALVQIRSLHCNLENAQLLWGAPQSQLSRHRQERNGNSLCKTGSLCQTATLSYTCAAVATYLVSLPTSELGLGSLVVRWQR